MQMCLYRMYVKRTNFNIELSGNYLTKKCILYMGLTEVKVTHKLYSLK